MTAFQKTSWIALIIAVVAVPTVVGTIPFGAQVMLNPFSSPAVLLLGLAGGTSILAWAIAMLRNEQPYRHHQLLVVLAALVLLLVLSTFFSLDRSYALFGDGDDLNGLAVYVLCTLLVPVTMGPCSSSKRISTLTSAVIASGTIVAVIALFQQLFAVDFFGEVPAEQRAQLQWLIWQGASTLGNPDFTGTFLVVPAVLAISRALSAVFDDWRSVVRDIVPAALIVPALALTLTRGAWLALAVGTIILFAIRLLRTGTWTPQMRYVAIAGGVVVLAVLAFAGSDILRRLSELAGSGLAGISGRSIIWSEALAIISAQPLFGTGPAAFRLGWYPIREVSGLIVGAGSVATDAHNYPLMLAAIGGIPAALIMAYLWIRTLTISSAAVWKREAKAPEDYRAWWVAYVGLLIALLTGVVTTPVLLLVFIGLGVLLAPFSTDVKTLSSTARTLLTGSAAVIAVACLTITSMQGYVHLAARSALLETPQALRRVADSAPWNGQIGLLAARLESDSAVQAAQTSGAANVEATLSDSFASLAERHPNDPEIPLWWSIQLFIAGDILQDQALLEAGLGISESGVSLYPNSLPLRTNRARALLDLGRIDEARRELDGIADADPNYLDAQEVQTLIDASSGASVEPTATP